MVEIVLVLLPMVGAAVGYLFHRWITNSDRGEETQSLIQTLELKERLEKSGLTIREARDLRDGLETQAIVMVPDTPEIEEQRTFADTTVGMATSMAAQAEILEQEALHILEQLKDRASPTRQEAFDAAHEAWLEYAHAQARADSLLYEGGTGQSPLYAGARLGMANDRVEKLKAELAYEETL